MPLTMPDVQILSVPPKNKPIGEKLVEAGLLTVSQVLLILQHQQDESRHQRFGDIAVAMGFVTRDDVEALITPSAPQSDPFQPSQAPASSVG